MTDIPEEEFNPEAVDLPPASELVGKPGTDSATVAIRASRILKLRAAGATYAQIAEAEGYTDPSTARQALMAALRRHEAENVTELRQLSNERLDNGLRVTHTLMQHENPMVRLKAVDSLVKLEKRRADLNGMDAPKQIQVSGSAMQEMQQAFGELRLVMGEVIPDEDVDTPPALEA